MASAFRKELVRSITQSAGRFAAIAIISFLGAGFYGGLRMAAPDMRIAGDEFFDAGNLHDIRVVSTLGLDDKSVQTLSQVEGVAHAMPTRSASVMLMLPDGDSYAAMMESLPLDAARSSDTSDGVRAISDDESYLNRPVLLEGTWPENERECVVSETAARKLGVEIGDTVTVVRGEEDIEDTLAVTDFRVIGLVNSSAYVASNQYGITTLGTGDIELYLFVDDAAFAEDFPYTNVYLTVEGARELQWNSDEYDQAVAVVKERVDQVADRVGSDRYNAVRAEAQEKLDDAKADYEKERADAEAELADAAAELADAEAELDDARTKLADAEQEMRDGKAQLDDSAAQIYEAREELRAGEIEYANGVVELENARSDAQAQLDAGQQQIDEQRAELAPALEQLDTLKAQRDYLRSLPVLGPEQQAALEQLEVSIAQIEMGAAALDAAQAELDAQRAAAEQQFAAAQAELDAARAKLDEGWAQTDEALTQYANGLYDYEVGMAEYEDGKREYEDGLAEYEDGKREYEDGVAEAEEGFAEAEQEIADAQAEIDDIEPAEVYVVDRSKNAGAAQLDSDADGIAQIASLFPLMFFLVAALVSLTSMTRMVDEERMTIGTHKALGYSRGRITSKYLTYGILASGVGSALGVVILGQFFPFFIITAYQISYANPLVPTPLDLIVSLKAIGLSVGVTALATWMAASASLRERPASLMLPRAPKAGKRILLERAKAVWTRLSFSQKVTMRNLFRYKPRFFMAVAGVAGCTALLMIGFGLRDAIGGIIDNQFTNLIQYDAVVRVDSDSTDEERAKVEDVLASGSVERYLEVQDEAMIARAAGQDDQRIQVVVPRQLDELSDYVALHNRESSEPLALEGDKIILTEKAANVLGVKVGDTVALYESNEVGDVKGSPYEFTVGGIAENYLGHYAYVSPEAYEEVLGRAPEFSAVYAILSEDADRSALNTSLLALDAVNTVSFMSDKAKTYELMLDVMNKLIFIIIAAAAALAFVVLYNLTNINIGERIREIATLKVLGFTPREAHAYIFREVFVMSFVGALLGCVIGVPLTTYIAIAAETPQMMFGRSVEPLSFVLSFAFTLVFTGVVAWSMRGKLRRISMVESLKSIE